MERGGVPWGLNAARGGESGRLSVRAWRGVGGQAWEAKQLGRESATTVWAAGRRERRQGMYVGQQTEGRLGREKPRPAKAEHARRILQLVKNSQSSAKLNRTRTWGCYPQTKASICRCDQSSVKARVGAPTIARATTETRKHARRHKRACARHRQRDTTRHGEAQITVQSGAA